MFVHIVNHHFRARIFFYETIHTLYVIIEISKVLLTFFWENWQAFGKFLTLPNAAGKFQQNTLCFSSSLIVRFPSFCWRRKRFSTAFAIFIVVVVFGGRKFFCSVFFCRITLFWVWEFSIEFYLKRVLIFLVPQLSVCLRQRKMWRAELLRSKTSGESYWHKCWTLNWDKYPALSNLVEEI